MWIGVARAGTSGVCLGFRLSALPTSRQPQPNVQAAINQPASARPGMGCQNLTLLPELKRRAAVVGRKGYYY